MARACTVCTHPDRAAIDWALAMGAVMRELAAKYRVSPDSMERHAAAHLPARLVKAAGEEDVRQALDVLVQLRTINDAALAILGAARAIGDADIALKAIDRIHRQLELQAKLLGELDDRPQINVLLSPDWLTVRDALLFALAPYQDAKHAVAAALARLEGAS